MSSLSSDKVYAYISGVHKEHQKLFWATVLGPEAAREERVGEACTAFSSWWRANGERMNDQMSEIRREFRRLFGSELSPPNAA